MSEAQQTTQGTSDEPVSGPSAGAATSSLTSSGSDAFRSKLSARNVSRNAATGSPKRGKQPPPHLNIGTSKINKSDPVDVITAECERIDLSAEPAESDPVLKSKKTKRRPKKEHTLIFPPEPPPMNFNINPVIHDYFTTHVGPMYSGSSAQYLDNLAHHPQFQYHHGLQAPHSAPVLQSSNSTPPVAPLFAPVFPPPASNPPIFIPPGFQNQPPSQKVNTSRQKSQFSTMNGVHQNSQYMKNLMQHPLLCNSMPLPQEGQSSTKTSKSARHRRKKSKQKQDSHTFDDYLSLEEVEEGLKNDTLFEGPLRINPKLYVHAYITTNVRDEQDIFIEGMKRRNRAMDGDIVVVEVIEKDLLDAEVSENDNGDGNHEQKKDDENKEAIKEGDTKEEFKNIRRGRVVYIKEKVHPRTCIGNLKLMPDKSHQRALFVPRDSRIPRLNIPCTSWPDNFYKDAALYEKTLFLANIVDWQDDRFALGTIIRNVGQVGDIKTETWALLAENDLNVTAFGPEVRKFFPGPDFVIPKEEIARREDCRKLCIFSIDPYNCRDVDDAVSCRLLENGNYEIGVHISDVSYYLKENTSLDEKVADKATTIYLVEKAYHMLPEELCLLCSLYSGMDKLAFSVFWEITDDAKVLSHRFTRTVINSCAQLAYEHAQSILDDAEPSDLPEIYNGFKYEDIQRTVKTLGKISAIFRRNRFEEGALQINQPKLGFRLDPSSGLPISFSIHKSLPSHQLIEEFMLLANMTVAERIHEDHPKLAFLRCHPAPSKFQLEELARQLKSLDIELDITSSGSLYRSLLPYIGSDCENQQKAIVLSMLCTKPMNRAKYFVAHGWNDDEFRHYALNAPLYTHFTSPIRRYADIMVHRLLAASLKYTEMPTWDVHRVRSIAVNCNKQKYNAKRAGEMSTELYTLKYIEMHSPVLTEAVVVDVKEKYFDVIVTAMGFNRRIYADSAAPATSKYYRSRSCSKLSKMEITWPATRQLPVTLLTVELFSVIQVQMVKGEDLVKVDTKLVRPS